MGRSPCCEKVGLKKGPWTPEEDQKLLAYIEEHGHGSWRALPAKAGLQRCGKSCRLRWTNYLRPDIKRGKFSLQEEQTIIQLHALLGNRWSAIATHLPKRTDNEIKNYWNTHLKKRLTKMGIDPVTHKPKNETLLSSGVDGIQSKNAANLSHMAQWESARLEAEARLVRESKLRNIQHQNHRNHSHHPINSLSNSTSTSSSHLNKALPWINGITTNDLESPTSTLTFSENAPPPPRTLTNINRSIGNGLSSSSSSSIPMIEFVGTTTTEAAVKEEGNEQNDWKGIRNLNSDHRLFPEYKDGIDNSLSNFATSLNDHEQLTMSTMDHVFHVENNNNPIEEGFTNLLLTDSVNINRTLSVDSAKDSENSRDSGNGSDYYEDNKNYWNSILNLVNSSPSDSPMF